MSSGRQSHLDDDEFTRWIRNHKLVTWSHGHTGNGALSIGIHARKTYEAVTYFTDACQFVSAVLLEEVHVIHLADFDRAVRLANKIVLSAGKFDLNRCGRFNGPLTYTSKLSRLGADVDEGDLDFLIRDVIEAVDRFRCPFISIALGNSPCFAMKQAGQEIITIDLAAQRRLRAASNSKKRFWFRG